LRNSFLNTIGELNADVLADSLYKLPFLLQRLLQSRRG
jgi:hypothetical protein